MVILRFCYDKLPISQRPFTSNDKKEWKKQKYDRLGKKISW